MASADFLSRIVGLIVFSVGGMRLGSSIAQWLEMPIEGAAFIFFLVGILFGLIVTPWITVRPIRFVRNSIVEMPVEKLLMTVTGGLIGSLLALLAAYPLSLLNEPIGTIAPAVIWFIFAYLGVSIFGGRSREILELVSEWRSRVADSRPAVRSTRKLLLDTSVLIDGRIVDIAETGFIGGQLIIPRFVLSELHRVADSSDALRRNRGRRGLNMLNKLQNLEMIPVRIIDDDFDDIADVDNKLVALGLQLGAPVVTNDYNLNQVAEAQGVQILNVNLLANAVRSIYIPGETFSLRIIQEGREADQGVGYLADGTMVVVERGKTYMDRNVSVTVTKLITQPTGRMIFAVPEGENHR